MTNVITPAAGRTTEKPSVRDDLIVESPSPAPLVSGKGRMCPDRGYLSENSRWLEALTEIVDGRRVGRHPMALSVETLTASGHGPRKTSRVVGAIGDVPLVDGLRRYKDLRRQCLACAENSAEVRRCALIDCPIWPYRMGKNPHNPRRGRNPFAPKKVD